MNIDNIKSLAEILSAHGLTALEVCDGDCKIRIEKDVVAVAPQALHTVSTQAVGEALPMPVGSLDFNHLAEVKSPLVGVFYSAPSPESDNFVSIGAKVQKGDVLCIVETMKMMNEILAEKDGEIVDICVKDGDIVEFGQVLFKLF